MMTYKLHDFGAETQQVADVVDKHIYFKDDSRFALLLLVVSVILIVTVDPAKEDFQVSAHIE